MKNHKRIILCGPSCTGKNFIRQKFINKGFNADVSYTSRIPREGEVNGVDYHFINKNKFLKKIVYGKFYEYVQYENNYYGTGVEEWNTCDIFIMETKGISKILPIHRPDCLIIFVNTPGEIRLKRMEIRGWNEQKITERFKIDIENFNNFIDFDIEIASYETTHI